MIEKRLDSLIESYTLEIEDETKTMKKYKDALENVLKESDCMSEVDNSRICSLHKIVERKANKNHFDERIFARFRICEGRKLK